MTRPVAGSVATSRFLPCPYAIDLHPHLLTAARVYRGPKVFWHECGVCDTRVICAPKILKARDESKEFGLTAEQAHAKGLTLLP